MNRSISFENPRFVSWKLKEDDTFVHCLTSIRKLPGYRYWNFSWCSIVFQALEWPWNKTSPFFSITPSHRTLNSSHIIRREIVFRLTKCRQHFRGHIFFTGCNSSIKILRLYQSGKFSSHLLWQRETLYLRLILWGLCLWKFKVGKCMFQGEIYVPITTR